MKCGCKKSISYVILFIVGIFIIGVLLGFFFFAREEYTPYLPATTYKEEVDEVYDEEIVPFYMIKAEDGVISMYYINGEEKEELRTDVFFKEVFPDRDVTRLRDGIIAQSDEEAIMVWENFTS